MERLPLLLAVLATAGLAASPAAAQIVLLRDDFGGSALDTGHWLVPTGDGTFLGRAQIRPPSVPLAVADGVIRLQLDTYNPSALVPGDSFFGSEIDSVDTYAVGTGLSFEARVRLVPRVPGGLVGSLFSFVFLPALPGRDEIDFELLSSDVVAAEERVLTNVFDDDDFSQAYDATLVPAADPGSNEIYYYEVDWVQVTRLGQPGSALRWLALPALAAAVVLAARRVRRLS